MPWSLERLSTMAILAPSPDQQVSSESWRSRKQTSSLVGKGLWRTPPTQHLEAAGTRTLRRNETCVFFDARLAEAMTARYFWSPHSAGVTDSSRRQALRSLTFWMITKRVCEKTRVQAT